MGNIEKSPLAPENISNFVASAQADVEDVASMLRNRNRPRVQSLSGKHAHQLKAPLRFPKIPAIAGNPAVPGFEAADPKAAAFPVEVDAEAAQRDVDVAAQIDAQAALRSDPLLKASTLQMAG